MIKGSTRTVLVGLTAIAMSCRLFQQRCVRRAERRGAERGGTERGGTVSAAPPRGVGGRQGVQDRLLERRRRRQRLPRGAGLHRQGRGARVGPGLRARPPSHRNTDAAGQLQDIRDLIAKGVDAIVFNPNDPGSPQPGARRGEGRRHQDRLGRRLRHRPGHLQPLQQPGRVRRARRQVAVRAARRQGHRLLHARPRRPSGRQRP